MSGLEKTVTVLLSAVAIISFCCFGIWEDKVTLYGPLLVLAFLAVAIWVVSGRKGCSLRTDYPKPFSLPPGGFALLLFWLYSAILIPFSVLPYEAKTSMLRFGGYFSIYWVSSNILSRFAYRKAVWLTLFISLIFVALYSLVQHKVAPNLIFGMERYTDYWKGDRLGGTYQCSNHIAHLYQMWIPFCFVFLLIPRFSWFWRLCFAYALPLFLTLIYQTQSRAGILGVIAAIPVTVLLLLYRESRRAFCIALLVVPLLGAVMIGGLWTGSSMFRARMQPVVKFIAHISSGAVIEAEFNDFRPQTWLDTIKMIGDRPVFGFGPGNYGMVYEDYRTRYKAVRVETVHPHNEYLELIAEYGAVGAGLIFWALTALSIKLIRFIKTADRAYHALPAAALCGVLAGTAVHGFFDFELRIFPNAIMLALLAGAAVAPLMQTAPVYHRKWNRTVRWIFVFMVLGSVVWSSQVMSSAWIRAHGDRLLLKQQFLPAEKQFRRATAIDPQNWQAWLGLGQVYYHYRYNELDLVRKREWALKEKAVYERAYRTNTKKEEILYGLGRVELFLGDRDKGLDYLRQAANYKRFNDFYWRKLGIELRKAGLYEEALKTFEYAQQLDPSNPTVKRNIQWLVSRKKSGGN